jgi:uncharacterized protein YciI
MPAFMYRLTPCRPTFRDDITPAEQAIVDEHFRYLQDLLAKGQLVIAGRDEGATIGIAVVEAESAEAAQQIMQNDPVVVKGVMTAQLYPFRIALLRGAEG